MGKLTTHVLDTSRGLPAVGVRLELFRLGGGQRERLTIAATDTDGRCGGALIEGADFRTGEYELVFHVAEHFRRQGLLLEEPPFLDTVVIRFGIAHPAMHYHVPLLVTPWSYSTYRGS